MIDRSVPPLALALAAVTSSQLHLEANESELRERFVATVADLDAADRAYRRAIEETLPPESAGALLSGMAAFRERVDAVRRRARLEIGELYRHYDRSYGMFDPLDSFTPPFEGLSHADGTRVATIADNARLEVDGLRAQVNEAVAKRLQPSQIETLIAAKRLRREAFEAALRRALEGVLVTYAGVAREHIGKTLNGLTLLADGWY